MLVVVVVVNKPSCPLLQLQAAAEQVSVRGLRSFHRLARVESRSPTPPARSNQSAVTSTRPLVFFFPGPPRKQAEHGNLLSAQPALS